ncbi:MAG: LAGLIDADG family homing endonuclease [Patescibacteria group bacterium]
MADICTLKHPENSHRKQIILPKYSVNLAEFFGIMIGDGGINNPWQANITLNSIKDAKYAAHICSLCNKLFGITPAVRKRKTRNTLVLSLASTSVVDFLVTNGLVRGNKLKAGLRIPKWILGKPLYKKACIRGLIDTDGCIFVHIHKVKGRAYRNIGLCFKSLSSELIFQVAEAFAEFRIIPHITKREQDIYLYQEKAVSKYLKVFGTSNERIESVYTKWRDARVV